LHENTSLTDADTSPPLRTRPAGFEEYGKANSAVSNGFLTGGKKRLSSCEFHRQRLRPRRPLLLYPTDESVDKLLDAMDFQTAKQPPIRMIRL
jgi:hypothetical protein